MQGVALGLSEVSRLGVQLAGQQGNIKPGLAIGHQ